MPAGISHLRAIGINIGTAIAGGLTSFETSALKLASSKYKRQVSMWNLELPRTVILAAAVAVGCASMTIDAFARGGVGAAGVGGAGSGHAAHSSAVTSGHAGAASRGSSAAGAGHSHIDGSYLTRMGHSVVEE
jgi:hypothetical protein